MKKTRHTAVRSGWLVNIVAPAAMALVALSGVYFIAGSLAASTNPYGFLDSCKVVGDRTVFYGWASDAQATSTTQPSATVRAGSVSTTVTTPYSYNTSSINGYIDDKHSGDPKPGYYGFQADMGPLYKGTAYSVSGTALNVGSGSNAGLEIYSGTGNGADQGLTFKGNVVPENCKVARPITPPTPAPTPTPTPTPTPAPTPTPTPTPRPNPSPSPGPSPATATAEAPAADANGGAIAGTTAVQISFPVGSATSAHIQFGTDPSNLDQQTPDQLVDSGSTASFTLTDLQPSTIYHYQLVRSNDAGNSTSPSADFTTANFVLRVHFANGKVVASGIKGTISNLNLSATSDKDGIANFDNVPAGNYKVSYTYQAKSHELAVAADTSSLSAEDAAKTSPAVLDYFIDVATTSIVRKTVSKTAVKHGFPYWIIAVAAALLLIIVILIARRKRKAASEYYDFDGPAAPPVEEFVAAPPVVVPPVTKPAAGKTSKKEPKAVHVAPKDAPEHMGESLKDMVLRSMAAQTSAAHRTTKTADSPTPPSEPDKPAPAVLGEPPKLNPDIDPKSASHHYPWN